MDGCNWKDKIMDAYWQMDGLKEGCMPDGLMERWKDEWMEGWKGRQMD